MLINNVAETFTDVPCFIAQYLPTKIIFPSVVRCFDIDLLVIPHIFFQDREIVVLMLHKDFVVIYSISEGYWPLRDIFWVNYQDVINFWWVRSFWRCWTFLSILVGENKASIFTLYLTEASIFLLLIATTSSALLLTSTSKKRPSPLAIEEHLPVL